MNLWNDEVGVLDETVKTDGIRDMEAAFALEELGELNKVAAEFAGSFTTAETFTRNANQIEAEIEAGKSSSLTARFATEDFEAGLRNLGLSRSFAYDRNDAGPSDFTTEDYNDSPAAVLASIAVEERSAAGKIIDQIKRAFEVIMQSVKKTFASVLASIGGYESTAKAIDGKLEKLKDDADKDAKYDKDKNRAVFKPFLTNLIMTNLEVNDSLMDSIIEVLKMKPVDSGIEALDKTTKEILSKGISNVNLAREFVTARNELIEAVKKHKKMFANEEKELVSYRKRTQGTVVGGLLGPTMDGKLHLLTVSRLKKPVTNEGIDNIFRFKTYKLKYKREIMEKVKLEETPSLVKLKEVSSANLEATRRLKSDITSYKTALANIERTVKSVPTEENDTGLAAAKMEQEKASTLRSIQTAVPGFVISMLFDRIRLVKATSFMINATYNCYNTSKKKESDD